MTVWSLDMVSRLGVIALCLYDFRPTLIVAQTYGNCPLDSSVFEYEVREGCSLEA